MSFDDWQAVGYALGLVLTGLGGVILGLVFARWIAP
jgi:hypothetical protein